MTIKSSTILRASLTLLLTLLQCIIVNGALHSDSTLLEGPQLYYWKENKEINFGDYISSQIVERIVGKPIRICGKNPSINEKKLLAVGSILYFAREGDIVWGSGLNGKTPRKEEHKFTSLNVKAIRGPLTRAFLMTNFQIPVPEIYGDPALLFPYLFPEFRRSSHPSRKYIVIPHFKEENLFPRELYPYVVYPTEPWDQVIRKILDSEFVISSALHGIVIAEAYGIPVRWLRCTEREPILKYHDYFLGTKRTNFQFATSIAEALKMGGEKPFECNLEELYNAFPFELWPLGEFKKPNFQDFIRETHENF